MDPQGSTRVLFRSSIPEIRFETVKKTVKIPDQDSICTARDFNRVSTRDALRLIRKLQGYGISKSSEFILREGLEGHSPTSKIHRPL
jgi:hypothetical protein